jgi:predicted DNA-binding transcriptional regulator YafY
MAKKSTPIEKAARLLDLVPFISSHQGISVDALATQFSISREELISDLNTLWMCGLPGYTPLELIDLEFESGFVSIRNADVLDMPRSLSPQEIITILLGLDLLRSSMPSQRDDILRAIDGVSARLRELVGDIAFAESRTDGRVHQVITDAINRRQNVVIDYHGSSSDLISTRTITPIEVVLHNDRAYLLAYCHQASAHRNFRIDRILEAQVADTKTTEPRDTHTAGASSETREATLEISSEHRRNIEALGVSEDPHSSRISVKALSEQWLLRTVISAGGGVTLITPPELRPAIQDAARRTLELYR